MTDDSFYIDAFRTIEECDLNNRPNYKKLMKHLKDNNQPLNMDEINYDDEIASKKSELIKLKHQTQDDLKKYGDLNVYNDFIDRSQKQQEEMKSTFDETNVWNQINRDMDKELKSLEMIQAFLKKTRSTDETKEIEIDESALVKANDILRHFIEQK